MDTMGLNIGIEVKKQNDSWGCEGSNPHGTIEEIEERFFEFLHNKYPLGGFGRGWVSFDDKKQKYDFDVRMFKYSLEFSNNYPDADMYLSIAEFIFKEFSHMEGVEMRTYWSG